MENKIENEKRHLILGVTGSEVKCMLFDSLKEIKASNPNLTDEEAENVYDILQNDIGCKQEKLTRESEYAEYSTED